MIGSTDTLELMVTQMKQAFSSSSSGKFLPEDFFGTSISLFANVSCSNLASSIVTAGRTSVCCSISVITNCNTFISKNTVKYIADPNKF